MTTMVLFLIILCFMVELNKVSACLPTGKHNRVTIGSETYVCVTLGPLLWNTTGEYLRVALKVQADQLSSIKIPQSWSSNVYKNDSTMQRLSILDQTLPGAGLGVSVSSMGILSYQRVYRQVLKYSLPTTHPTPLPSLEPTGGPSQNPTEAPSSNRPSEAPTVEPTTSRPTEAPTTAVPTLSLAPTVEPTDKPTAAPSIEPTLTPTAQPTTTAPSQAPTVLPTAAPSTSNPSVAPSEAPTPQPSTLAPSVAPSQAPSVGTRRVLRSAVEEYAVQFGLEEDVIPSDDNSTTNSTTPVDTGPFGTKSVTFPMLMAIISVDNGKVQSVVWDDFCNWCSSKNCAANTVDYNDNDVSGEGHNCYVSDDSCVLSPEVVSSSGNTTAISSTTNLCELNVYITWHGTDSAGAHFQSAASRFSRLSIDQMKNVTGTLQDQRATY